MMMSNIAYERFFFKLISIALLHLQLKKGERIFFYKYINK